MCVCAGCVEVRVCVCVWRVSECMLSVRVCVSGYGLTEAVPSLLGLAANVARFILFTYLPLIRLKQQVAKHQLREGQKERGRDGGGGGGVQGKGTAKSRFQYK